MRRLSLVGQILAALGILIMFFTSIELLGDAFKLMGKDFARTLLETTANPFVGLFIGILATSLVQSSSTVTSMAVTLVAGGGLTIAGAIPIVMGANIGTSVTNTIVSLGSITRKDEFKLAMAGATVHDFFNLLAVLILFPLELMTGFISHSAAFLTEGVTGFGGAEFMSPVKALTDPIADFVVASAGGRGIPVLIIGLLLLFISLRQLVTVLRSVVLGRSEGLVNRFLFGKPIVAMLFGIMLTILVQSSSITTSLTVPLVAAGLVTVTQIYPFVLGANIGTTVTAILAALVLAADGTAAGIAALTVSFAHLFFNVYGILLFFPIRFLRDIPIRLAHKLGDLAVTNRAYALLYVVTVFFIIPLTGTFLTRGLNIGYDPAVPESLEERLQESRDSTRARLAPPADSLPGFSAAPLDALPADTLSQEP